MRRNQIPQAAGLREMKFYLEAREVKARRRQEGSGEGGGAGRRRIIETGRVQLGREIEMLSPSGAYHHQRQRGEREKPIKESKYKYEESCRKLRRRRSTRRRAHRSGGNGNVHVETQAQMSEKPQLIY